MVTVTPGRTALVLSVTLPLIAPVVELVVCAVAATAMQRSATTARVGTRTRHQAMLPSPFVDDVDEVATYRLRPDRGLRSVRDECGHDRARSNRIQRPRRWKRSAARFTAGASGLSCTARCTATAARSHSPR